MRVTGKSREPKRTVTGTPTKFAILVSDQMTRRAAFRMKPDGCQTTEAVIYTARRRLHASHPGASRLNLCTGRFTPKPARVTPDQLKTVGRARDLVADLGCRRVQTGKSIVAAPMTLRSLVLLQSSLGFVK